MTQTNMANAFSTQLTEEMSAESLQAEVGTTTGAPGSPCILCIEPGNDDRREYILFDGNFTGTRFVTTALGNRYLEGSAAGSGITHPTGSLVTQVFTQQHFDELHDRIGEIAGDLTGDISGKADNPHGDAQHNQQYVDSTGDTLSGDLNFNGNQAQRPDITGYTEPKDDKGSVDGAVNIDFAGPPVVILNPTDAVTLNWQNLPASPKTAPVIIVIENSSHAISYPTGTQHPDGGATPELSGKTILWAWALGPNDADVIVGLSAEDIQ